MSIVLVGSTSGSVTLQEPAVAGTTVLTLPAVSGTVITTGTTGQVIDSGALPVGSVLQVINGTTLSPTTSTSATYVQTNLTASITPKFVTSKIAIFLSSSVYWNATSGYSFYTIYRNNTTNIGTGGVTGLACMSNPFQANTDLQLNIMCIDSPATTSATSYTLWVRTGAATSITNDNNTTNSIILMEIAA